MKKVIFLILFAVILSQGSSLFAQQNTGISHESEYYFHNFAIETIYTSRMGFLVLYRNSSNKLCRTHIPHEWFQTIGGKGEIVYLGTGPEWPSMVVYYKNGEFSHVRLRLRRNMAHESWGVVPLNINIDERFKDIEEVKIDY